MKIGAENKKELVIMACLLAVAIPLVIYTVYRYSGGASAAEPATAQGARPQGKSGTQTMARAIWIPRCGWMYWKTAGR